MPGYVPPALRQGASRQQQLGESCDSCVTTPAVSSPKTTTEPLLTTTTTLSPSASPFAPSPQRVAADADGFFIPADGDENLSGVVNGARGNRVYAPVPNKGAGFCCVLPPKKLDASPQAAPASLSLVTSVAAYGKGFGPRATTLEVGELGAVILASADAQTFVNDDVAVVLVGDLTNAALLKSLIEMKERRAGCTSMAPGGSDCAKKVLVQENTPVSGSRSACDRSPPKSKQQKTNNLSAELVARLFAVMPVKEFLPKLRGMYSLLLLDKNAKRAVAARSTSGGSALGFGKDTCGNIMVVAGPNTLNTDYELRPLRAGRFLYGHSHFCIPRKFEIGDVLSTTDLQAFSSTSSCPVASDPYRRSRSPSICSTISEDSEDFASEASSSSSKASSGSWRKDPAYGNQAGGVLGRGDRVKTWRTEESAAVSTSDTTEAAPGTPEVNAEPERIPLSDEPVIKKNIESVLTGSKLLEPVVIKEHLRRSLEGVRRSLEGVSSPYDELRCSSEFSPLSPALRRSFEVTC